MLASDTDISAPGDEDAALSGLLDGESGPQGSDAEIFHEQTKLWRGSCLESVLQVRKYLSVDRFIQQSNLPSKRYPQAPIIALAEARPLARTLDEALKTRRSYRTFGSGPISAAELGSVLRHALGVTRVAEVAALKNVTINLRAYPSGGGLYPIEFYPVLLNVPELPRGICRYEPRNHELAVLKESLDGAAFMNAVGERPALRNAAVAIVLTAVFPRSTNKYGSRGYRFALLEAGHAAQNICLVAQAAGLRTLMWGEFFDDEINGMLGVDGVVESVVSLVFMGRNKNAD